MSSTVPAPSKRNAFPSLHFAALIALILFLGLALLPKAFEFRAWPVPSRHAAIEEVVDRPVPLATEVRVAGVHASSDEERGGARGAAGEPRPGARRADETERVNGRSRRGGPRGSSVREERSRRSESPAPGVVEVPEDAPLGDPPADEPAPEQPAKLAEVPQSDPVMRPEVGRYVPPAAPVQAFEAGQAGQAGQAGDDEHGELDVRGHRGRRHRWDRPGHRGRGHGHHGFGE